MSDIREPVALWVDHDTNRVDSELGVPASPQALAGEAYEMDKLILVGKSFAEAALETPQDWNGTKTTCVRSRADKLFMTITADNGKWEYQLADATWRDSHGKSGCYLGIRTTE